MKYVKFKKTNYKISRLGFGTGPLRKCKNAVELLVKSYKLGINFWDTADCYATQKIVGKALKKVGRENIIVQTKIDSLTAKEAQNAVKKALKELQTNYIDIMLLHYIPDYKELERRMSALKELLKFKKKGIIKHIGFSTHSPKPIIKTRKEMEVILATINEKNIENGTAN